MSPHSVRVLTAGALDHWSVPCGALVSPSDIFAQTMPACGQARGADRPGRPGQDCEHPSPPSVTHRQTMATLESLLPRSSAYGYRAALEISEGGSGPWGFPRMERKRAHYGAPHAPWPIGHPRAPGLHAVACA